MKVKISYLPEEEKTVAAELAAFRLRHPAAKIRRSDRHPPYRPIYLATGAENSSCKEETDAL